MNINNLNQSDFFTSNLNIASSEYHIGKFVFHMLSYNTKFISDLRFLTLYCKSLLPKGATRGESREIIRFLTKKLFCHKLCVRRARKSVPPYYAVFYCIFYPLVGIVFRSFPYQPQTIRPHKNGVSVPLSS